MDSTDVTSGDDAQKALDEFDDDQLPEGLTRQQVLALAANLWALEG
jgi:hypothetical protein